MCNFYYGNHAWNLIKKKKALPLNGNLRISFDHVEIFSRKSSKLIHINEINKLPLQLKRSMGNFSQLVRKIMYLQSKNLKDMWLF